MTAADIIQSELDRYKECRRPYGDMCDLNQWGPRQKRLCDACVKVARLRKATKPWQAKR